MKITIDIDCTPEEAREFMGLPDMQELQKSFMESFTTQMKDASASLSNEDYMRLWKDIGLENMQSFQKTFWEQMKNAGDKTKGE